MNLKEVIKTLELAKAEVEWNYPMDYAVAIDEAIKAVEKQIAKKPVFNSGSFHFCPTCVDENKTVSYDFLLDRGQSYCRRCGQKILWEVEE